MTRYHLPSPPVDATATADWWLSLLSGTVAALITGAVVYGVFLATRKTERERAKAERTRESVAKVIEGSHDFTSKSEGWKDHQAATFLALKRFTNALMEFAAREIGDHQEVAKWAIDQSSAMGDETTPILFARDEAAWTAAKTSCEPDKLAMRISACLLRWLGDGGGRKFDPELPESIWDF